MTKKIIAILICAIFAAGALVSCGDERALDTAEDTGTVSSSIFDSLTQQETVDTTAPDTEETAPVDTPEDVGPTDKEIVQAYVDSRAVWEFNDDRSPMYGKTYGFIDVDFDGVLELVSSLCDGSGRFSQNRYYRINTDDMSVELFYDTDDEGNYDGVDYNLDSLVLIETEDGHLAYVLKDQVSAGMASGVWAATVVYYYEDGEFHTRSVGNVHYFTENTYSLYNADGESDDVTREEYEAYMKEQITDRVIADFGMNHVIADDSYNAKSADEKCEALLGIYRNFLSKYAGDGDETLK